MCRHCQEDGVVQVRWLEEDERDEDGDVLYCEWMDEPDDVDDDLTEDQEDNEEFDDELPSCGEEAELLVQSRMIEAHLCDGCAAEQKALQEEGVADFLQEVGLQDGADFLALGKMEAVRCDECGQRATQAHLVFFTQCFCREHAKASGARLPPRD